MNGASCVLNVNREMFFSISQPEGGNEPPTDPYFVHMPQIKRKSNLGTPNLKRKYQIESRRTKKCHEQNKKLVIRSGLYILP